jgi:anti-sigma regulatory factor (Ser/Thr protein kinase)
MDTSLRVIYRIAAQTDGPARARRIVARELALIVPPETLEGLKLMVSELVTNAVKYGARDPNDTVMLDLRVGEGVRCTVIDYGPGFADRNLAAPGASDSAAGAEASGWGLKVVGWLAERWGVTRSREGTRVWFEAQRG